ncbi:MAG: dextranase, partial [Bifidobacterium crudilactis]|nr:dextranase [Bifidobacterium crudilactis]
MHAQWGKLTRHRSSSRRSLIALTAIGAALMMLGSSVITATAAEPTAGSTTQKNVAAKSATQVADTESLHTWWHDNAKKTSDSIADDTVRESPFYTTQVASASSPDESYKSFTYMSVPRNGNGKIGYTEQDGAEFSSEAGMSMSW